MVRQINIFYCFIIAICVAGAGCGEEPTHQIRLDPEFIGGKADAPGWLKLKETAWSCGESIAGKFEGYDSAFRYRFTFKTGYRYAFEFDGSHDDYRGTVIAIYSEETGRRVARVSRPQGNEAQIAFTPTKDGVYQVAVYSIFYSATGDYTLRAKCQIAGMNDLKPGQSEFFNHEQTIPMWRLGMESTNFGAAKTAPAGRSGEVEEADIYKVEDNKLFYFNTYRGFMIFDIEDPKAPQLTSRLPVFGYPVEMFIQNNTVYALLRDALYLTEEEGEMKFKRHHVSQLVAIDISDLKAPKVLQSVDIIGDLREGVSRKIQDTIYVVSYFNQSYYWGWQRESQEQKEQAWVYSFNVSDPRNLQLMDKLKIFEGGSYAQSEEETNAYEQRNFNKVTISATSNTLLVAENWYKYGYVPGSEYQCGTSTNMQQAIISIVDISDTSGKIKLHTKFETYGELGDQFKQTYLYDQATGKGTYLGIFARREWNSIDCVGDSLTQNNLESWDVTDGGNPVLIDRLPFGKPNESVRGSTFDTQRKVAFAITAEQVDPLYALSFANPGDLRVLSEVDGLSGDMNVFRFIADKKFLIGIGRDNSDACTGFGGPAAGWTSNVAVSIIDVQDLTKIRLVQRKCVTFDNASWISSSVNWDLDQAHKMIGMHSDGLVNVITVPVSYSVKEDNGTGWWYRRETAVGMMGWDLSQYDSSKSELEQQVLETFGTVIHPQGEVRRSIIFTHQAAASRRKMINLSNTHLSLVDINNLQAPVIDAEMELAPYYSALYRFGGYMATQLAAGHEASGSSDGATEFRIKPITADLEHAPTVANFSVGRVQRAMKFGDNLVIFRYPDDQSGGTREIEVVIYDLTDPTKPELAGTTSLPLTDIPYLRYRCGVPRYSLSFDSTLAQTEHGIVLLKTEHNLDAITNAYALTYSLVNLDLSNPHSPVITEHLLPSGDSNVSYVGLLSKTSDNSIFLTSRKKLGVETLGGTSFEKVQYFAQEWSNTSGALTSGAELNIPGRLAKSWDSYGTELLLTHDSTYEELAEGGWGENTRLNLVRLNPQQQTTVLIDSHEFTGLYLRDIVLDDYWLYISASERGGYIPGPFFRMSIGPSEDQLMIFDLWTDRLQKVFGQSIGTESVDIMGLYRGQLFLNLPSDGILVVNVENPEQPYGQQFLRTLDYASHLDFSGDEAFVAAGYYGIYQFDLVSGAQLSQE